MFALKLYINLFGTALVSPSFHCSLLVPILVMCREWQVILVHCGAGGRGAVRHRPHAGAGRLVPSTNQAAALLRGPARRAAAPGLNSPATLLARPARPTSQSEGQHVDTLPPRDTSVPASLIAKPQSNQHLKWLICSNQSKLRGLYIGYSRNSFPPALPSFSGGGRLRLQGHPCRDRVEIL